MYSTVQYSTEQYNTVQYSTVQHFLVIKDEAYQLPDAVLRIRDILVRIRIRGSVPLTEDPIPDPAIFVMDLQDGN